MHGEPDQFGSPYRLLAGSVVPRPIAWVSTRAEDGTPNLAPFSFYNVVSVDPPVLMFAPVGVGEERKDTAQNVIDTGELVVHAVTRDLAEAMNETSATLAPGQDEFEHAGLEKADCEVVDVPRVERAKVAFECSLYEVVEVGDSTMVLAEVEYAHADDDVLTDGEIDVTKLDAVGRLSGSYYASTDSRFSMERPP